MTSKQEDYGGAPLGHGTYANMRRGLQQGEETDEEIAAKLLASEPFEEAIQSRAAAVLYATVGLAEMWRKHGADKLFRAVLRCVEKGDLSLEDALETSWTFKESADAGRKQVGRFQDVAEGDLPPSGLSEHDRMVWEEMSEVEPGDLSSDEEMRDAKALKKNRLYARKHRK